MISIIIYLSVKLKKNSNKLKIANDKLAQSEENNRELINANPDMLFILDSGYNFVDYKYENESELYASPSEFIGKNITQVLPADVAELTIRKIELLNKSGLMQSYEYDLDQGGEKQFYESRIIKFGKGKILIIIRNISARKKRDDETIRSHKLESLGIFAGGIAHDFNNILSAIVGYISLARKKINNKEKVFTLLEKAEKEGMRARKLTEQLLAFSKGGTPVKQITDIAEVVKESAEFIMSGSKTALEYKTEDNISKVDIDRGQVGQVIQNIILNASQAMPSGGVITISIRNVSLDENNEMFIPEGDYVAVSIKDEGDGIESKNIKRIFDPYFTTKNGGNGLGLTICHTIIKTHGGGIDVRSEIGHGSEFILYLPSYGETESENENIAPPDDFINLRNLSVLIMDDEPQLRYIMKELLKDEGAKIYTVTEGSEAIDLFEKMEAEGKPVDLIIADLTIPGGMGGMEAVRIMREQGVPFRAIVISGYSNDPVLSDYKNYGFDAFIAKPFSLEDLLSVVRRVMER